MRTLGAFRTPILAAGVALVFVAGCSSSAKKTTPTTTSSSTTSSSSAPETTTSEAPASTSTTTTPPAPTSTTTQSSVRITGYTVSPATPVCNGPTMIQLGWTAVGASSVDLAIDGSKFASYGGGTQTHLEYFACDGRPHTYQLTARGPGATATATKTVSSTVG